MSAREHLARRGYGRDGMAISCKCGEYKPVSGTVREQEDAHRAHRVEMGETVQPRTPGKVERLEAENDRLRAELDGVKADLDYLHRIAMPSLRREIQHHQDGKQRWRDRAECDHCRPLVEAEAAGCEARQLTERSIGELWHWIDGGKPFYSTDESATKWGPDGCPPGLKVDGLSVFSPRQDADAIRHDRHVARFGDWIIRHPDGQWSVHKAPAQNGDAS